jgi:hypothetical protein
MSLRQKHRAIAPAAGWASARPGAGAAAAALLAILLLIRP